MIYFLTETRGDANFLIEKYDMKCTVSGEPFPIFESDVATLGVSGSGSLNAATLSGILFTRREPTESDIFVYVARGCGQKENVVICNGVKNANEKTVYTDILFDTDISLEISDDKVVYGAVYSASKFFSADRITVLKISSYEPEDIEKVFDVVNAAVEFQADNSDAEFYFTEDEEKYIESIAEKEHLSFQRKEMLKNKMRKIKFLKQNT